MKATSVCSFLRQVYKVNMAGLARYCITSMNGILPLSKLIGLLFLFCLPLHSILFLKTKRNDLARPVMGTIFLVYIYICCRYVGVCLSYVKLTAWAELRAAQAHAQSLFFLAVKPVTPVLFISYTLEL